MKLIHIFLFIVFLVSIFYKISSAINREELSQELKEKYNIPLSYTENIIYHYKVNNNILKIMDKPAESRPWNEYKKLFINEKKILDGIHFYNEHKKTIDAVSKTYKIPQHVLVAIMGIESNYGRYTSSMKAIDAICTLAFHYERRSRYFLDELKHFILYTYKNKLDPFSIKSSYAGAIGLPQFMPSSINTFGVDFDKDGVVNLTDSYDDALASIAYFLLKNGWQFKKPSIIRLYIPKKINIKSILDKEFTVNQLNKMGIKLAVNTYKDLKGKIIRIDRDGTYYDYWIAFNNFKVLKRYNPSNKYSLAIVLLANIIAKRI